MGIEEGDTTNIVPKTTFSKVCTLLWQRGGHDRKENYFLVWWDDTRDDFFGASLFLLPLTNNLFVRHVIIIKITEEAGSLDTVGLSSLVMVMLISRVNAGDGRIVGMWVTKLERSCKFSPKFACKKSPIKQNSVTHLPFTYIQPTITGFKQSCSIIF